MGAAGRFFVGPFLGAAEEGFWDAVEARWVFHAVMCEIDVVAVDVDAVVIGEEREDVWVKDLFCPAPRFNVSCCDIISVKLHDFGVVHEETRLEGGEVDGIDEFVVHILQPPPFQVVRLRVVQDPLM